jgi:hypothetical protein
MSLSHRRGVVGPVEDDVTAALSAAQPELTVSALNTSLLTEEWRFVSNRLLWVLPGSASNVPVNASAATALGTVTVFDVAFLHRSALRSFLNQWVDWSAKWNGIFGNDGAAYVGALMGRGVSSLRSKLMVVAAHHCK